MVKRFNSKVAPKAVGPYSHASVFQEVIYLSGQLGLDPQTDQMKPGGIEAETRQALENIQGMLDEVGSSLEQVIRCRLYLIDLKDFALVNSIYGKYFGKFKPARTTIQVAALPMNGLIEIECTAKIETFFN